MKTTTDKTVQALPCDRQIYVGYYKSILHVALPEIYPLIKNHVCHNPRGQLFHMTSNKRNLLLYS